MVDAASRLLEKRRDGGNIFMTFAWQRINQLAGAKISMALAGTVSEDEPEEVIG